MSGQRNVAECQELLASEPNQLKGGKERGREEGRKEGKGQDEYS